jgi:hypothetical protein
MKRPSIHDVERDDLTWLAESFDVAETKEDGIWTWVKVRSGVASIIRRSGQEHARFTLHGVPDCTLCAEHIVWSPRAKASREYGGFVVFDCIESLGKDLAACSQGLRRTVAEAIVEQMPRGWRMVRQWDDLNEALQFSIDSGLEGIVIKRTSAPYGEPWARVVL